MMYRQCAKKDKTNTSLAPRMDIKNGESADDTTPDDQAKIVGNIVIKMSIAVSGGVSE